MTKLTFLGKLYFQVDFKWILDIVWMHTMIKCSFDIKSLSLQFPRCLAGLKMFKWLHSIAVNRASFPHLISVARRREPPAAVRSQSVNTPQLQRMCSPLRWLSLPSSLRPPLTPTWVLFKSTPSKTVVWVEPFEVTSTVHHIYCKRLWCTS